VIYAPSVVPTAIPAAECDEEKAQEIGISNVRHRRPLHDWTANGKGKMPAYKDKLSADEMKALGTHFRTFGK
jgi:hypothetical protein